MLTASHKTRDAFINTIWHFDWDWVSITRQMIPQTTALKRISLSIMHDTHTHLTPIPNLDSPIKNNIFLCGGGALANISGGSKKGQLTHRAHFLTIYFCWGGGEGRGDIFHASTVPCKLFNNFPAHSPGNKILVLPLRKAPTQYHLWYLWASWFNSRLPFTHHKWNVLLLSQHGHAIF